MPRVSTKTKSKGGKAESYRCDSCPEPILPKQQYYEWSFRYGGTHRQHVSCGPVKQSQLTQSKMSGVYAAVEAAEAEIASAEDNDALAAALETCADSVDEVKDEYQESLDNMISQDGSIAQEVQEKIETLESFADELRNATFDEFDEEEPEEPTKPDAGASDDKLEEWEDEHGVWSTEHSQWEENRDQHLEDRRSEASDILGNLSI